MRFSPGGDVDPKVPIVVDLGKAKKKQIALLKEGDGPLLRDVQAALNQVRARLGPDGDKKELVPVVLVYRRKRKKRGLLG
jgi:hypothetical protein